MHSSNCLSMKYHHRHLLYSIYYWGQCKVISTILFHIYMDELNLSMNNNSGIGALRSAYDVLISLLQVS